MSSQHASVICIKNCINIANHTKYCHFIYPTRWVLCLKNVKTTFFMKHVVIMYTVTLLSVWEQSWHQAGRKTFLKCSIINICYHNNYQTNSGIYTGELTQSHWGFHASSSSTSTPSQSLGWRNITGFPWAPILGSADRVLMFFAFRSAIAAFMSSTCDKKKNVS